MSDTPHTTPHPSSGSAASVLQIDVTCHSKDGTPYYVAQTRKTTGRIAKVKWHIEDECNVTIYGVSPVSGGQIYVTQASGNDKVTSADVVCEGPDDLVYRLILMTSGGEKCLAYGSEYSGCHPPGEVECYEPFIAVGDPEPPPKIEPPPPLSGGGAVTTEDDDV